MINHIKNCKMHMYGRVSNSITVRHGVVFSVDLFT